MFKASRWNLNSNIKLHPQILFWLSSLILSPSSAHSPVSLFILPIWCPLLQRYIFFLLSRLMSLPFSSSTDPSTSSHLLLLPHHYSSFSTHLSKAAEFPSTTVLFCCLLIESLSSSNGSVRISWEQQNRWIDRAGEGHRERGTKRQRDEETEREAKRKWGKRRVGVLDTFICTSAGLRAAAPLTRPTSHHMVWQTLCYLKHRRMVTVYTARWGQPTEQICQ